MEAKGQKNNAVSHPEHLLLIKVGHKAAKYMYKYSRFCFYQTVSILKSFQTSLEIENEADGDKSR